MSKLLDQIEDLVEQIEQMTPEELEAFDKELEEKMKKDGLLPEDYKEFEDFISGKH